MADYGSYANSFWQALADNAPAPAIAAPTPLARVSLTLPTRPTDSSQVVTRPFPKATTRVMGALGSTPKRSARTAQNYQGKARSGQSGTRRYSKRKVNDRMSRRYRSYA